MGTGRRVEFTLAVSGGDTLEALLDALGARDIEPLRELAPGIVFSRARTADSSILFVSKAGGFGDRDFFPRLRDFGEEGA
jgi:uncharacterized protein YgbK (DUF1537 family)